MNRVSMRPAVGFRSALASGAALISSLAMLPLDALAGECVSYGDYRLGALSVPDNPIAG